MRETKSSENTRDTHNRGEALVFSMSQRELAEKSGISLRTIQQYEQRKKNINKAQIDTLIPLSMALYCEVRDLLEPLE